MVRGKSHDQSKTTGAFVWHPALAPSQICFEQGWVQISVGTWLKEGLAAALLHLCFVPVLHEEIPSLTQMNNPPFPAGAGGGWLARPHPPQVEHSELDWMTLTGPFQLEMFWFLSAGLLRQGFPTMTWFAVLQGEWCAVEVPIQALQRLP